MNLPAKQETKGLIRSTISGEIKIRHFKNSVPIEQALPICFQLTGLSVDRWPSKDPKYNEWQFLIDFILENYKMLVAKEIPLAFKLAIQNKLGNVDIKHYGNFSTEYFARIISAYQEYKARELQIQPRTLLKEIKQTTEQARAFWKRFLFDPYDKLKAGEPYLFDENEGADRYQMLEILGVPMSNKEITLKYKNLYGAIKGNNDQARKKTNKLRRELKAELFKSWIIEKAFEGVQIKDDILSRL